MHKTRLIRALDDYLCLPPACVHIAAMVMRFIADILREIFFLRVFNFLFSNGGMSATTRDF